jgi:hypothetical protein
LFYGEFWFVFFLRSEFANRFVVSGLQPASPQELHLRKQCMCNTTNNNNNDDDNKDNNNDDDDDDKAKHNVGNGAISNNFVISDI